MTTSILPTPQAMTSKLLQLCSHQSVITDDLRVHIYSYLLSSEAASFHPVTVKFLSSVFAAFVTTHLYITFLTQEGKRCRVATTSVKVGRKVIAVTLETLPS